MNFLISDAMAQTAGGAPAGPSTLGSLIPLIIMIVLFWFLLLRPQMKRQKEHKKMLDALSKGDEVVTNGGLLGRVVGVGDSVVEVEVAENLVVKVQKQAVAQVLPKGSVEAAS